MTNVYHELALVFQCRWKVDVKSKHIFFWNNSVCLSSGAFDDVDWETGKASGLRRWWFDWSFARLIAPVVTTSVALSSNKIQNGDILVPANPGPPENGH